MKEQGTLTEEEKAAGVKIVAVPFEERGDALPVDVTDRHLEQMARGFIMGTQSLGRRREIKEELEDKVVKRIGKKGKHLVDKLFELIEGVYTVQAQSGKEMRYYKVPPNLQAIVYALDRVLGKPKAYTEHTEEKRGIILVEHVIKNLAGKPYVKNGVGEDTIAGEVGGGSEAGIESGDGAVIGERIDEGAG
jgi:hypothetical protein